MWLMLQQDEPDDYVVATGVDHSVRDLCEFAFGLVKLDYRDHVVVDEANLRPSDVAQLRGDATKARAALGWEPAVDFHGLIRMMIDADLERLSGGKPAVTPART
jgi:GDPmannose 4,6-dehydratase